ncbi:MAG: DUF4278 domain-containing protein [Oculatellaceae cyanobacterium Prado106]|jgi:hypothetical protein|nr:DUF4278 domain-containing protein [Oculatellaceae cyanobacterium Prado106]
MKLQYRGVAYNFEPPNVTVEPTALTGRYRGVPYSIPNLATEPVLQPIQHLVYRGVPYSIGDFTPEDAKQVEAMIPTIAQAILEEEALYLKYQLHHPMGNH